MQSEIEGMWNVLEYALKDSRKMTGQLEEWSDSKVLQIELNVRTLFFFKGGIGFICFLNLIKFLTAFA